MKPTVNRLVHWFQTKGDVPSAAMIVAIHEDKPGVVNLVVWNSAGHPQPMLAVAQYTEDTTEPFWDWAVQA